MEKRFGVMLKGTTIRARVAFALALAEHALGQIQDTAERLGFARAILIGCWEWERGKPIRGEFLRRFLEREDETGLWGFPFDGRAEDRMCWDAVVSAGYYATWQAYRLEGERTLPEAVNEVDDGQLDFLASCLVRCPSCDVALPARLAQVCVAHYRAAAEDELGEPVDEALFGRCS